MENEQNPRNCLCCSLQLKLKPSFKKNGTVCVLLWLWGRVDFKTLSFWKRTIPCSLGSKRYQLLDNMHTTDRDRKRYLQPGSLQKSQVHQIPSTSHTHYPFLQVSQTLGWPHHARWLRIWCFRPVTMRITSMLKLRGPCVTWPTTCRSVLEGFLGRDSGDPVKHV